MGRPKLPDDDKRQKLQITIPARMIGDVRKYVPNASEICEKALAREIARKAGKTPP